MRKMRVRTSAVVNWEHSCGVTMLPQLAPFRGYVTAATLILLPSTSPSPALLNSAAERAQMAGTSQRGPGGEGGAGSGRRVNPPRHQSHDKQKQDANKCTQKQTSDADKHADVPAAKRPLGGSSLTFLTDR